MSRQARRCPLCGSTLTAERYFQIVGVWEERRKLEDALKGELRQLQIDKARLRDEIRRMRLAMKREVQNAAAKATEKERKRADRLAAMIQGKSEQIQFLTRKVKELQEQLKRGTTPSVEGLNYELELIKDLKREFPKDRIEHYGKGGDILHTVVERGKDVGTVLIECKLTSHFSRSYVVQTKRAVAQRNATYGVLVTLAAKKGTAGFWIDSDVLVVHPFGAIHVVSVLRQQLVALNATRVGRREADKRASALMEYIRSDEFKNLVGDTIFRTVELYAMLKKEVTSHKNAWKKRYEHYRELNDHSNRIKARTTGILHGESSGRLAASRSQPKLLPLATL